MLLCFHCKATCIIWLEAAYLSQHAFEFGINHVGSFHLFMKVCESHLVFSHFWHLCSGWTFQHSFAFRSVLFKKISRCVAVQAAFAVRILALVEQKGCESFHIAVVCVVALPGYH